MKMTAVVMVSLFAAVIQVSNLSAHCQIPCGIYDDHARIEAMLEDVQTVKKAVKQIQELASKSDAQSENQRVRWIMNKEKHAQYIIAIISDYFLTQRIKPSQKDYTERLIKHHAVILAAMKVKQNVDIKYINELETAVKALEKYYPEHEHKE